MIRTLKAGMAVVTGLALAVAVTFVAFPAEAQYLQRYIGSSFTSTAVSGQNGFACRTNGCRVDLGTGANDYFASDGAAIGTPAQIQAGSFYSGTAIYVPLVSTYSAAAVSVKGAVPATAAAGAAVKIGNAAAVNAVDGKIVSFYSDNMTTERAWITADGSLQAGHIVAGTGASGNVYARSLRLGLAAIGTCDAASEGALYAVPGSGAVKTKLCVCTYTPTGAVYAWVNALTNNAGTGVGNTTTCP